MRRPGDNAGQEQQRDQVGEHHQGVEQVGQVPHQIDLERRADHDAHHDDRRVDLGGLLAEQRLDVGLAEEVPTDEG